MVVIFGPTSSGKTSLALKLCKQFNGEIISADSRQVYKEMDIGTGKLPVDSSGLKINRSEGCWNINGVNIWGYDLVNPDKYFSVYDFAIFARNKINELQQKKKQVFLVGGTGFFLDVTLGNMVLTGTKPDAEKRKSLETTPTKNLLNKLRELNLEKYNQVDKNNRVRIIRALEIELNDKENTKLPEIKLDKIKYIGLEADRDFLYKKIDNWVEEIWANGVVDETKNLMKKYPASDKLNGIVYKTICAYLRDELTESNSKQQTKFDVHAYVRRQETWFKKYTSANYFNIEDQTLYKRVSDLIQFQ